MPDTYVQRLTFTVDGQASDTFAVFRFSGREAISEPFRFEIDVVADSSDLALATLAGRDASLTITRLEQSRSIHGMIERIEQHGATPQGQCVYRAILVPRLHRLALSRQNQIHGTTAPVSVRDVLAHELPASALKGAPASAVSGRLGQSDFELRLTRSYPQRDYIVQYEESDLAFISRLCEHYGIFYFFSHDSGRDVVVFGDSRIAFPSIGGSGAVAYKTASGLANAAEPAVFRFIGQVSVVPARVCLRDYNYRLPNLTLEVDETVDPEGHGVVVDYGSHFRTPQEGRDLARVRAQELACRKQVFSGASDSVQLAAGAVFDLTDHFRQDFNAGYLVTWIEHEATQALPGIAEFVGPGHQTSYRNSFECLPKSVEFRPARKTPKPRMPGLSNAVVDGTGSGQRAEIDSVGRYKIRQQFDQRGEAAGQSSRYMRKAEPYGGANTGMHFPLLKGTEVILACVNGDPDRPIIVGAMQNEQYPSVVNSSSNTMNRIRTTSGTLFEIDDGPAGGGGGGSGAGAGAVLAPQRALEGATASTRSANETQPLIEQRAEAEIQTTGSDTGYARLQLPDTNTQHYWRLGNTANDGAYKPGISNAGGTGVLLYTANDGSSMIKGSSYEQVDANSHTYVNGTRRTSAGKYNTIAKSISIEARTGTLDANSAPADASDGDMNIKTTNNLTATVGGDLKQDVEGDLKQEVSGGFTLEVAGNTFQNISGDNFEQTIGLKVTQNHSNSVAFLIGSNMNFTLGDTAAVVLGATTLIYGLSRFDLGIGLEFKFRLGFFFNFNAAPTINMTPTKIRNWVAKVEGGAASVASKGATVEQRGAQVEQTGINAATGGPEVRARALSCTF